MVWFHSCCHTSTKTLALAGLGLSLLFFPLLVSAAPRILPSIPIPAPHGQHTEVRYHTTMVNKAGNVVQVGRSSLTSQINGTAPLGQDASSPQPPLKGAPKGPANIQTMARRLVPSASGRPSRSGLGAFKTNAPLTAQQQAVANALTARFAPDQKLTPLDVLKPTFMHSRAK